MKKAIVLLFCLCFATVLLAEPPKTEPLTPGPIQTGLFITGDNDNEGEANVYYDDGTFESDVDSQVYANEVPGNKFDNPWTAYYCKAINVYVYSQTGGFFLTGYDSINTANTALSDYTYDYTGSGTNTNTWLLIDNPSPGTADWINGTSFTFNNTMWIGNSDGSSIDIGVDTNGGNFHGYYCTSFTGAGYTTVSHNLGIRATFAGDSVPVELMEFSAE